MKKLIALLAASFFLSSCGVSAPVTLKETDSFRSIKKTFIEPLRYNVAVAPVAVSTSTIIGGEENVYSGSPDSQQLQDQIVSALKEVPVFDVVEPLSKEEFSQKDAIKTAGEKGLNLIFETTVKRYTISLDGNNGRFTVSLITWLLMPMLAWCIADETYTGDMTVDVALKPVDEPEKPIWTRSINVTVTCDLSDFQRGVKLFRLLPTPGTLSESNWQNVMEILNPHLKQKLQLDLIASIISGITQPPPARRNFAVIVGLNEYSDKSLPAPKYAAADADSVAEILNKKENGYFKTILLKDSEATAERIEQEIKAVSTEEHTEVVNVFFYFAGLGATKFNKDDTATQYLLTHEANINDDATLLSLQKLCELLNASEATTKTVVIDAGFFSKKEEAFKGRTIGVIGEEAEGSPAYSNSIKTPAEGFSLLLACQANETAVEMDDMSHGLFSKLMIDNISGPPAKADVSNNGDVTAEELFGTISWTVTRTARVKSVMSQQPFMSGNSKGFLVGPPPAKAAPATSTTNQ
ncbi:MAG: caspase family protein [Planctomycetota bacterium]